MRLTSSLRSLNGESVESARDSHSFFHVWGFHSQERMFRRVYTRFSVLLTLGVTVWYTPERFERRRKPLPHHRSLVWLDPTEVRSNGLWIGGRWSLRRNYGLRRTQIGLFLIPGLRVHEAHQRVRRRRRLWRLTITGVRRGHVWRIPMSWVFFEGWSSGVSGRVAEPRLSHYVEWWFTWDLWMVGLCHAPWRITLGLMKWRSMGYPLSYGLRRYSLRFSLLRGARVTPPDVGSQRRVAIPRMMIRERCIMVLRLRESMKSFESKSG